MGGKTKHVNRTKNNAKVRQLLISDGHIQTSPHTTPNHQNHNKKQNVIYSRRAAVVQQNC